MTIGERIRQFRKKAGLTLQQLGEAAGVSKQTVQRYESGVIANIPAEKIEALAEALSVTPSHLMGWEDICEDVLPVELRRLPILGRIACGEPVYADEEHESFMYGSNLKNADFCLIAQGESMVGARIFPGDAVFIHRQDTAENGQIAAVIIDGEATLKRFYYHPKEKKLILTAENPSFAPLVYVGNELEQVRVLGIAVAFQSRLETAGIKKYRP